LVKEQKQKLENLTNSVTNSQAICEGEIYDWRCLNFTELKSSSESILSERLPLFIYIT